jgi:hypothetical protein
MMGRTGLLLGFGALLVLGLVLSQIELGFIPRSPTLPTTPGPSREALVIAELRSKELEVSVHSCY